MTNHEATPVTPGDFSPADVPDFIPNQRGHLELIDCIVLDGEMLQD